MQKVTNLGRFVRNRLPSAQNVPLCAVRRGRGGAWLRGSGGCWWCGGRGPPGDPPECGSGWSERCLLVVCLVREWGGVAHSFWGAGRGGGVVPTVSRPRGTSGNRMNVQRRQRCTFILVLGPGLIGESARFCHLLIAVCRKNVQLRRPGQLVICPRPPAWPASGSAAPGPALRRSPGQRPPACHWAGGGAGPARWGTSVTVPRRGTGGPGCGAGPCSVRAVR